MSVKIIVPLLHVTLVPTYSEVMSSLVRQSFVKYSNWFVSFSSKKSLCYHLFSPTVSLAKGHENYSKCMSIIQSPVDCN